MKILVIASLDVLLGIACASPNNTGGNRSAAVNTEANANAYLKSENAYTFSQISDLADKLSPSGKEAREIVGKTVTEAKLWRNKAFDTELRGLMGADYATMRKSWDIETPIKKFGDFLMMTGCEQHNCRDNQYVIFIDLGDGRINVVNIGKDTTREWNAYGEINLPPPFAEELAAMKEHK
jgi:hypothetical protein